METSVPPMIVIPVRLRGAEELDGLLRCLVATWSTIEDADVLVVDDHGPAELAGHLAAARTARPRSSGTAEPPAPPMA